MEFDYVERVTVPDEVHRAGSSEQTGFPSPATHYLESRIDLNAILSKNRDATFFIRVKGDGWKSLMICDQDVLIVDRAAKPVPGKLAIVVAAGAFSVQRLPKNSVEAQEFMVWGVITYIIHAV